MENARGKRGWCPDAWRPMAAGDGLLVRVKPRLGRIEAGQVLGLCDAALRFGNGLIDLTNRANLQIRGVSEQGWPALLDGLIALDLVDPDPDREARRNLLIAPDWQPKDDSARLAETLVSRLADLPPLPSKIGFAIDAGPAPLLQTAPADFRIERAADGALLLRADGRANGTRVTLDTAVDALIALAHWFVDTGGSAAGRVARHAAALPAWADGDVHAAPARAPLVAGPHPLGQAFGVPFGSIKAQALRLLIERSRASALRLTPWRTVLLEGERPACSEGFVDTPDHPALRVAACPGMPACPQATVETRALALRLAPHVAEELHLSGCAKGCAHPGTAEITVTGRDGRFDLAFAARAGDPPSRAGLTATDLLAAFGAA
ncbi:precorrin-3B synthase [Novosphingobium sp. JCM 18896]|uniref:precorrin-3B synthase n=1 Tax=Novosphingobium sp. JCM 18896 TaxID=2989731 RepID=UPI002221C2B2|nr:precorrin-3B synthase [Novosphingobium sp. JCM 18896]MCW1431234.1 precorrin-3B synthase [Novosphingobium sp. JCM 18896]